MLSQPRQGLSCFTIFGFGYDHLSDSYKTVGIYGDPEVWKIEYKTLVKVYTLGRDTSWRKMQSFPFFPSFSSFICCNFDESSGKFVNGTLNWRADRPDGSLVIVSIDLANETCGEISLPHFVDGYDILTTSKLWVIGDCLCFSYVMNECQFVLWKMKVYGDTESWTMLLKVPFGIHQDFGIHHHFLYYLIPTFMFDHGEVLLQIKQIYKRGIFLLYNPRHNSFKYLELQNDRMWCQETTHIESLVSPFQTVVN